MTRCGEVTFFCLSTQLVRESGRGVQNKTDNELYKILGYRQRGPLIKKTTHGRHKKPNSQ